MHIAHISPDGKLQTCQEHSRNTAMLAEQALSGIGLSKSAYLAGLLHDAGKFTSEFNEYIQNALQGKARRGSVIHSFAGGTFLLNRFHPAAGGQPGICELTSEILACAVISHHGLVDLISEDGSSGFEYRKTKQPEYDQRAVKAFLAECAPETEIDDLFQSAVQEIADLLNRFPETQDYPENMFYLGFLARMLTSAVVSGDRKDTARFMLGGTDHPTERDGSIWDEPLSTLHRLLASFPEEGRLQQARRMFSDCCFEFAAKPTGIYRLDLPTGSGKTLCALRYAMNHAKLHQKRRIIYVAPLLSVIEQNAEVIHKAVGDDSLVLEHHSNLVSTLNEEDLKTAELLQESWDAPIIVTTMVRLLEVLFSGKMADVRRMQALCASILILDEVQSIPTKVISMFNCAMNFLSHCCGTTIVLCSATQPPFNEAKHRMKISPDRMIGPALLASVEPLFRRTNIQYDGLLTSDEIPAYIANQWKDSGSLLIVCNTKAEAAKIFHQLSTGGMNVFFLSAGMCMAHRKKSLKQIMEELHASKPMICVSTQVIEAGIDISFDTVIRMSAGLDNIVQCAGRCNRNGEHPEPQLVHILTHADQKLGPLKGIAEQQNALNCLIAQFRKEPDLFGRDLASEASVTYYYKNLFKNMREDAQDYPAEHLTIFSLLSTNTFYLGLSRKQEDYGLNQAFKTAGKWFSVFDEDNRSILVPYKEGKTLIEQLEGAWEKDQIGLCYHILEKAKAYSLSVNQSQLNQLMRIGAVKSICEDSILIAEPWCYDDETGLLSGKTLKEKMEQCNTLIL